MIKSQAYMYNNIILELCMLNASATKCVPIISSFARL